MWVVLLLHVSGDDAHEDVAHLTNNSRREKNAVNAKIFAFPNPY